MFDTMIETRRAWSRTRAIWPYPVAASMHFLVVGGMIASSLLVLRQVPEFENPFGTQPTIVSLGPGLGVPPPLGQGGLRRQAPGVAPTRRPAAAHEIVQPRDVPQAAPQPDAPTEAIEQTLPSPGPSGLVFPGLGGDGTGLPWGVEGSLGDGSGGGPGSGDGRAEPALPAAPVEITPDMAPPVLIRKVAPEYPAMARTARLPGFVLLQAVVGEDGDVDDVTVLRASSPLFVDAAVKAVRQWRYRAALQSGRPVRVYFTVRVEFQLR